MRAGPYGTTSPITVQKRGQPHFNVQSIVALIAYPWFAFVLVTCIFALPPQGWVWRVIAAFVFLICQALAGLLALVYYSGRKGPIYLYLGALFSLATIAGCWAGTQVFDQEMVNYWMQHEGEVYSNIAPSSSAAAVKDASIIQFSTEARVDLRRVLGFRPQGSDVTYCVAPVLDSTQQQQAQFWAVGTDCCEPLRSFLCDDSGNPGARSGLIVSGLGSNFAAQQYARFQEAAQQAALLYGLTTPKEPALVRWFQDAADVQKSVLGSSILEIFLMSFMYLMASVFVAAWLHLSAAHQRDGLSM